MTVVVVGGGLGGLAAGLELADHDVEVVVLEASTMVGGRARTKAVPGIGGAVELGGEFIGRNHPTWIRLAGRFGLTLIDDVNDAERQAYLDGQLLDGDRLAEVDQAAQLYSPDAAIARAATVDLDEPWSTVGADGLDYTDVGGFLDGLPLPETVLSYLRCSIEINEGAPVGRLSLLGHLVAVKAHGMEDYWTLTEATRCAQGSASLANAIRGHLGDSRVQVAARVTEIWREGDIVRTVVEDGRTFASDGLVLAIPPPSWTGLATNLSLPWEVRSSVSPAMKLIGRFNRGLAMELMTDTTLGWIWSAPVADTSVDIAFATGERASQWSAMSPDEIVRMLRQELSVVLGHDTEPELRLVADWPADDSATGYSFVQTGEVTSIGPTLIHGLGRVQFAGDWASIGFRGFMEGALESGQRAARQLVTQLS